MTDWRKWVRVVVGAALAFVVLTVVMNIVGDYRAAKARQQRTTRSAVETGPASSVTGTGRVPLTTPTGTATGSSAAKKRTVLILVAGVNMRQGPTTTDDVIRRLDKNERLAWVSTQDGYYQVRDTSGKTGWVSAKTGYTRLISSK